MRKTLLRIWIGWFVVTTVAYALWQIPTLAPDSERMLRLSSSELGLAIGTVLYWFQLPGMIVHGPHGGYGDWRDPAIVIPITAITYSLITTILYATWHLARRKSSPRNAT